MTTLEVLSCAKHSEQALTLATYFLDVSSPAYQKHTYLSIQNS